MASTYPYVHFMARDTNDNPITVELRASSESGAVDEGAIVAGVRSFLEELPGVHVTDTIRYAVTETPQL